MKVRNFVDRDQQDRKAKDLTSMLRDYYLDGCEISLEGREAEPWQVVDFCLREPVNYMMDFIPDDSDMGKIGQIDFVRIGDEDDEDDDAIPEEKYVGWCR